MEWIKVYDLTTDQDYLERVQHALSRTEDSAQGRNRHVFGSSDWWSAVETGELETHWITGVIKRPLWTGMNDFPQVEIEEESGRVSVWTRRGGRHPVLPRPWHSHSLGDRGGVKKWIDDMAVTDVRRLLGGSYGGLRVSLTGEGITPRGLLTGDLGSQPLVGIVRRRGRPRDLVGTYWAGVYLVSERFRRCMSDLGASGWFTTAQGTPLRWLASPLRASSQRSVHHPRQTREAANQR
jgi:hypothetical protein